MFSETSVLRVSCRLPLRPLGLGLWGSEPSASGRPCEAQPPMPFLLLGPASVIVGMDKRTRDGSSGFHGGAGAPNEDCGFAFPMIGATFIGPSEVTRDAI